MQRDGTVEIWRGAGTILNVVGNPGIDARDISCWLLFATPTVSKLSGMDLRAGTCAAAAR